MTRALAILHVLRAPVGGLFRHVLDLAETQADRGHRVGLIADSLTGGETASQKMAALAPKLELGVSRTPMSRHLGWRDGAAVLHVSRRAHAVRAEILHGHGAKGGAFARLATCDAARIYTPHGGSLHYDRSSPVGAVYLLLEKVLRERTDAFLFESAYGRDVFSTKVGRPRGIVRVIHNGLRPEEFAPVAPAAGATDVLYVGELRRLKGVDVLIDALSLLHASGHPVTATIVGAGPDADAFRAQARPLGGAVRFTGAQPARSAFALGRCLVVPSRAESLPYIVLEAAAAAVPIVATRVGGMAEIFGPLSADLVPAQDPKQLAEAIRRLLEDVPKTQANSTELRARILSRFSLAGMTDQIVACYEEVLRLRKGLPAPPVLSVS